MKGELEMILELLRANGSIIINKKLAHSIGIDAAVMYSELLSKLQYFSGKGQLTNDGFFFNTVENMEKDTTLTKYQQKKAIQKLVDIKLIQHENRGLPQKRHFKVNEDESIITKILGGKNSTYKSKKDEQLEVKKVNSNNTNFNNIKLNNNNINKDNIYLISDENEVFAYYSKQYTEKFNKDHPKMNFVKMSELNSNYDKLRNELNIYEDKWYDLVDYHFDNLSKSNNGNILSFLALNGGQGCVYRYLEEIDLPF